MKQVRKKGGLIIEQKLLLREADIEPNSGHIALALKAANDAYIQFTDTLKHHEIEIDWRYYKDTKAWLGKGIYKWTTSRGTPKEITVCWLSIWEGFFRVGLTIPERCRLDALNLPISDTIKKMIENAQQMGKMKLFSLSFDLSSNELFDDVYTLVNFKKTLK